MTFLLCEAEMRLKDNALIKLNKLIKWTDIKEKMGDLNFVAQIKSKEKYEGKVEKKV